MDRQATPYTPKERTILSHLVKKVLRAWWSLVPQKTWEKLCVLGLIRRPSPPSLRYTTPSDNQLNVIGATKTPFAVSDHSFLVAPREGQISDTTPWCFR